MIRKTRSNRRVSNTLLQRVLVSIKNTTRYTLVLSMLGLAGCGIVVRAVYLQLLDTGRLQEEGNERFLRTVEIPAHRGMIVDRNGEPLAVSSPVDSIWAQPTDLKKSLKQQPENTSKLAALLGMKVRDLTKKLAVPSKRQFVYLRRHLSPDQAKKVLALKIPGVHTKREYRRYYPDAKITSHLLGFTNIDDIGQEGVEKTFDDRLRGIPGKKRVIKNRLGQIVKEIEILQVPQPGQTLTLSIDRRLQYLSYRALRSAVIKHRAKGGTAVVVDVRSGEILAIVNQPAGNPNDRKALRSHLLRNRAVTDIYEPGSTMKTFAIAMALESGRWRPGSRINTAPGKLKLGRSVIRDVHNYGVLDVTRVLSKSSNVGTSKIALSLPAKRLWQLYKDLGFGSLTGVGLIGEQAGILRHFKKWGGEIGHANHSFGYGLSVNMLQLARAYTALASRGVLQPLTVLKRQQPVDNGTESRRVLSERTTKRIWSMLEKAVSRKGTGFKANVPGYRVAGKTGTVHKVVNGRYSRRYLSLFAGMAPASNPRLVMVVIIDEPRGKTHYGGTVAAPVFSAVMGGALRILNVTPDDMPSMKIADSGGTVR
ncbi:MAG: cell division protein [Candidatus Contendobacter odensis]|uniref:Peptidoglycan D,D-transpeptidase FtsI n=1 Tax=Candidatus Contendibacter odensensis TaxID=1400860 RepID=A0A2G6PFY8_9GAMM|nr:MAG: cell division protein [Candidatus Contendobacter odensis]